MLAICATRLAIFTVSMASFCGLSACFTDKDQSRGPSLAETLEWMEMTYDNHKKDGGDDGHGTWNFRDKNNKLWNGYYDSITFHDCIIRIVEGENPDSSVHREVYSNSIISFDLKYVDLSSLKLSKYANSGYSALECNDLPDGLGGSGPCNLAELNFNSTNNQPVFEEIETTTWQNLIGKEHESKTPRSLYKLSLIFDDQGYAARFERAFRHAVELCGGRAAPF